MHNKAHVNFFRLPVFWSLYWQRLWFYANDFYSFASHTIRMNFSLFLVHSDFLFFRSSIGFCAHLTQMHVNFVWPVAIVNSGKKTNRMPVMFSLVTWKINKFSSIGVNTNQFYIVIVVVHVWNFESKNMRLHEILSHEKKFGCFLLSMRLNEKKKQSPNESRSYNHEKCSKWEELPCPMN